MIPTELIYLWSLIRPGSVGYIYKFSWYGKWARRHKCHEISKVMSHVHGDPPCLHPCEHGQRESIPGCSSKWASKQNPKTLPSSIFTAYSSRIEIDIQAGVLCSPTMCYPGMGFAHVKPTCHPYPRNQNCHILMSTEKTTSIHSLLKTPLVKIITS